MDGPDLKESDILHYTPGSNLESTEEGQKKKIPKKVTESRMLKQD